MGIIPLRGTASCRASPSMLFFFEKEENAEPVTQTHKAKL